MGPWKLFNRSNTKKALSISRSNRPLTVSATEKST